jgi:hypothetical protein
VTVGGGKRFRGASGAVFGLVWAVGAVLGGAYTWLNPDQTPGRGPTQYIFLSGLIAIGLTFLVLGGVSWVRFRRDVASAEARNEQAQRDAAALRTEPPSGDLQQR